MAQAKVIPMAKSAPQQDRSAGAYGGEESRSARLNLPYFRLFPSDWRSMLQGLSLSQTAICVHLHLLMLESGRPVPEDEKRLARLLYTRTDTIRSAVQHLIDEGKIERTPDGLWSEIAAKELANRQQKSDKARASVAERIKKDKQNQTRDQTDYHLRSQASLGSKDDFLSKNRPSTEALEPTESSQGQRSTFEVGSDGDARPTGASPNHHYKVGDYLNIEPLGRCVIRVADSFVLKLQSTASESQWVSVDYDNDTGKLDLERQRQWEGDAEDDPDSIPF